MMRFGMAAAVVGLGLAVGGCSKSSSNRGAGSAAAATTSGSATATTSGSTAGTTSGAGTTGGGTTGGGGTTIGGGTTTPLTGSWYAGDLHGHSAPYSQDAHRQGGDPPGMAFFLAETAGLDYMALTDHRTMDQVNDPTYSAQTLTILDGEEWGGTVHIGMVGITRQVPEIDSSLGPATLNAQVQAAYDDAHRQGGIVITNHPCQDSKVHIWLSRTFDAVEVWNAYWNFPKGFKDADMSDVDDKVRGQGLAAIGEDANPEIRQAVAIQGGGSSHQALKFWEAQLNAGRKKAIVGGGDRHSITFPGIPTTYVFARDKTRPSILEGIRNARTWVGTADGPKIEYNADTDGDGVYEARIGDSVPLNRAIDFRLRVQNSKGGKVEVVKNGQTILRYDVLTDDDTFLWTDTSAARSWIRVDVFEKVDFTLAAGAAFQVLATVGSSNGAYGLQTIGLPLGFQIAIGTRYPTIKLPHEYDKILNLDRLHWGYSRGAITSPIWFE